MLLAWSVTPLDWSAMPLDAPPALSKPYEAAPGLPPDPALPNEEDPGVEEDAPLLLSVGLKVWSAMVAHSVDVLFGVVLRFESCGDGALRYAAHPLADVLRGIA